MPHLAHLMCAGVVIILLAGTVLLMVRMGAKSQGYMLSCLQHPCPAQPSAWKVALPVANVPGQHKVPSGWLHAGTRCLHDHPGQSML